MGGGWSTVYLNAELGRRLPWLRERVFAAASEADHELWGGILKDKAVNLRCAEYHTVTPPGNLAFERHYDLLLFLSHKYHCVSPVESGTRNVLVAELWEG